MTKAENKFALDFAVPIPYTEISTLRQGEQHMENRYYCGWDGGGTKTEVLCVNEAGQVIGNQSFGPLNINGAGKERVGQSIRDCMAFMAALPGGLEGCLSLAIGTAGVSNKEVSGFITDVIRACGYAGPLILKGDQDIALEGAVEGAGAVLVAGTGSVCCGKDAQGNGARSGGCGHLIDDEGGGYAIGRDILSAAVRAEDNRIPPTLLTGLLREQMGFENNRDIITWLYAPSTGKKEVAALAPLMLKAMAEGDEAARQIALKASRELAELVKGVWRSLKLEQGELAFVGSILLKCDLINREVTRLCEESCPGLKVIQAHGTPAQGAVKLACRG